MAKSPAAKSVEAMTYEAAFADLQAIVAKLEAEPTSLDEAMAMFERGQALVKRCAKLLEEAELKVKKLSGDALSEFEED
jgi:exodeoxyribonuclease VII small subunit